MAQYDSIWLCNINGQANIIDDMCKSIRRLNLYKFNGPRVPSTKRLVGGCDFTKSLQWISTGRHPSPIQFCWGKKWCWIFSQSLLKFHKKKKWCWIVLRWSLYFKVLISAFWGLHKGPPPQNCTLARGGPGHVVKALKPRECSKLQEDTSNIMQPANWFWVVNIGILIIYLYRYLRCFVHVLMNTDDYCLYT